MKILTMGGAGLEGTYGSRRTTLLQQLFCLKISLFLAFVPLPLSSRLSWKSPKQKLLMCEYILSLFQTFIYDRCKYSVNNCKP